MSPVLAATPWPTNGHMIADVAGLYLRKEWRILDPTYGRGKWWTLWRPDELVTHDLRLDGVDFRRLPHPDSHFDAVAFDPPYKLNGTPGGEVDERYGVHVPTRWQDRHQLIREGIDECARVLRPGGIMLVKCQDQVVSGEVRWQAREFTVHAEAAGLTLVDEGHVLGGRPQPPGRRQVHLRRNYSTLLVLRAKRGRPPRTGTATSKAGGEHRGRMSPLTPPPSGMTIRP